ncbi:telomerase inhibitor [Paraconiothyrium brasiliense]|uniref:PinX1-related protein 1 n=1 Tax=Paraconiothyrium brasiliense TaxID=300254 RepID=A0ABR3QUH2_9PLEO
MGLAAPKNASRSKISNDPQNTTWANNTERFGHRILTSQGWTPGSSLGATDAAHKAHYTAASHSHIRVLLKDDNLGLGAKRGSERAENFGLAGFASILGRLNGKEEEVKKEEERQEKIAQRAYVYQKFGMMNFVSGGFLVGDKIEKGVKREIEVKVEVKSEPESSDSEAVEKKSKKRKRSSEDEVKLEEHSGDEPQLKRKKKSMNLREEAAKEDAALQSSKSKKEKKDKKDKKSKSASGTPATDSEPVSDKARRKAEKRARKEEKKLKKALKKAAKEAAKSKPTTEDPSSESEEEVESTSASSVPTSGTATPSGLTYNPRGMHAVRQRYIRQKKMASMDPQALKEIFMIKTPS